MQLTGAEIVVECLKEQGVVTVLDPMSRGQPMRRTDMHVQQERWECVLLPAVPGQPIWLQGLQLHIWIPFR